MDYSWAARSISGLESKWTVVATGNTWSLWKPWTWVVQPVNRIELVLKGDYGRLNRRYAYVHCMSLNREQDPYEWIRILDLKDRRMSGIGSREQFESLDNDGLEELHWTKFESLPSWSSAFVTFLEDSLPPAHYMVNFLGDEYDVSKHLQNGDYRTLSSTSGYHSSLLNSNPYKLSANDIDSLNGKISYLGQALGLGELVQRVSIDQVRYVESVLIDRMIDVFAFDGLCRFERKDTSIYIRFTIREILDPNWKAEPMTILGEK